MTSWILDKKAARFYEQNFVPAIFAEWASLLAEAAGIARGQRVLDVACGTGIAARTAAARVGPDGKVAAIDLNSSMLEVAREAAPHIDWREGDAANLPFESDSFDAVLCQAALMFFPDPVKALQEMRRVVRKNGTVAVQVWGKSPGYEIAADAIEQVAGAEEAQIFRAPWRLKDPEQVRRLFANAGFDSVKMQTEVRPARYPSLENFARTEIDGWVLAGRVDTLAFLNMAHHRLKPYVSESGAVNIPLEGFLCTASKNRDF